MKKKLPALLCALALILSLAGCVISTPDTVGTIGDVEITSGLYLLAQYNAYQSAANLASSDQDAANVKSFLKETITTDPDTRRDRHRQRLRRRPDPEESGSVRRHRVPLRRTGRPAHRGRGVSGRQLPLRS